MKNRLGSCRPLILCGLLIVASSSARGQTSAADRARLQQSQAMLPQTGASTAPQPVEQGYAASSPNDADLGEQAILKEVEKYQLFRIETGVPIYYTSNVALVERGSMSDAIIAPLVSLTYAPPLTKTLFGEFTVRQQFFYYQDFSDFNFASLDLFAGVAYVAPQFRNLLLRANLNYNRLTATDSFDDFFSNVALNSSAELPIPIDRAQQISLGADASVSLYADPEPPRRNDFGLYIGYAVGLTRNLSLLASGRLVVRPYNHGGRTDVSEILSVGANYQVRDWLVFSAYTTFVANQSNRSALDYEVFNIGGGVAVSFRF